MFSVEAAVNAYVQANASIREPDGKWHPSSIFACDRKALYERRGVEQTNPKDDRSGRVLFIGSRWHEIVQAAVIEHVKDADQVLTEVPVELPELNIVGHADQLIRFGDVWELEEYKSISSNGFRYLKGPKPEHVSQAYTYMYALRTQGVPTDEGGLRKPIPPLGDSLTTVRFVYISKDDLKIAEYVVPWDPAFEAVLRQKVTTLDRYVADPISLPPRLPLEKGKKNWLCAGYCEFRDRCWQVDATEVAPGEDIW